MATRKKGAAKSAAKNSAPKGAATVPDLPEEVEQHGAKTRPGQRRRVQFEETIEDLSDASRDDDGAGYVPGTGDEDEDEDDQDDGAAIVGEYVPPPPSPLHQLLRNLQGAAGVMIYVIRKPDPAMMRGKFREPCAAKKTSGQIPFEESFTDPETIELAVQTMFGGGCYELQVRRGGSVLKSWSPVIDDLPESQRTRYEPESTVVNPAPSFEHRSEIAELLRSQARLDELKNLFRDDTAPAAPRPSLDDKIYELAKDDTSLRTKIIDKYLGGGDEGGSWLADALKQPEQTLQLAQGFVSMLQGLFASGGGQPAGAPQLNGGGQPAASRVNLPADVAAVFQRICANCAQDTGDDFVLIEASAAELRRLAASNALYKTMLDKMLARSPFEIMSDIAQHMPTQTGVLRLDHAASWFTLLKVELQGAEGEQ